MAAVISNFWNGGKTLLYQIISQKRKAIDDANVPSLSHKVAIVTGGNSGIGLETVKGLCKTGMSVIIACRSEAKAAEAITSIKEDLPDANVKYMNLDLTSLESIKTFAKEFKETESDLHILVNNAGVMHTPYTLTKEGFEIQIGVNHIGHYSLTMLLLDVLKRSGSSDSYARIVTVSSAAGHIGTIKFDDLHSRNYYNKFEAYSQSKLANMLFTYALQRRLTKDECYVTANCLHPGVVNTNLFRYLPYIIQYPVALVAKICFMTAEQGAQTSLYGCLSKELESRGGLFLDNCQESTSPNNESYDKDIQEKLWEMTASLTGL